MKDVKVSSRVIELVHAQQSLVMAAIKFAILESKDVVLGPDFDKDNLIFIWEMDLDNCQHIIKIANGLDEANPEIYMTKVQCWPCKSMGAEETAKHHIRRQLNDPAARSALLNIQPVCDVADYLQALTMRHLNYVQSLLIDAEMNRSGDVIRVGNYVLPE